MKVFGIIFNLTIYSIVCLAKNCDQIHEYLDADGVCRECEMCDRGFEPSQHLCGYGTKDPLYNCQPCLKGSYSSSKDYKFCVTCSPCAKRNSKVHTACSNTSDAVCGECYSDYFRPQKSDGNADLECFKCMPGSTHQQCLRKGNGWKTIAIALLSVVGVLVVLTAICFYLWCQAKNSGSGSRSKRRTKSRRSSLFKKVSCDSEVTTSGSLDPLTEDLLCSRLPKCSTQPLLPPSDLDTYSHLPTAQYEDSGAYHNLPTSQFSGAQNINTGRFNAVHHSGIIPLQGPQHAISNNRLDDVFRMEIDSFDTNSAPRSLNREQTTTSTLHQI